MNKTSIMKKMLLLRLRFSLIFFSFLTFISLSNEKKLLIIKLYFKNLFQKSIDDLDSYEKNLDFLSMTKAIPDEELDEELMIRITHARQFLGLKETGSFRLKRLRLAGIEYIDLINHLTNYKELRSLDYDFYSGEGRRSLGLILHGKPEILYITKIIKNKNSYMKELNFYTSIQSLGKLSMITPRLVLNSEFNGVFLITLEYVNSQTHEKSIPIDMIMESFSQISSITRNNYNQIAGDIYIDKPLHFQNFPYFKRKIYKNLLSIIEYLNLDTTEITYLLSKLNSLKINEIVWTFRHGDNLSWNYKLFNGKVYIIDWESYSWDIFGSDFFGYVITNRENFELIEEFISIELKNPLSYKKESLLILFIFKFNDIINYIKKTNSNEEVFEILNKILEKFNENNW